MMLFPSAMYALSASAEGDCYRCVPPDLGIEAAALGASESSLPGTAPAEALHTFTLDSGASRCFFRDSTTLTPLPAPVSVRLGDPSEGPVVASSSTVLPCPVFPSGSLSGLHLPSFSTTWVESVHTGYRASSGSCVCPGFYVRSGSTPLLVLPPVAPDSPVAPPPWTPLLATPAWHALPPPCLWSSQVSASPPALVNPALPSLRRDAAARRSSLLLVSPDNCSPADSPHGRDLLVMRLHSERGGEFSSVLFRNFCRGEGILQSFTLPVSPQQNGIAERRIGLVMEVARTSMIHAAAPHFQWPFAVRYAVHQLNLWPRVSLPETLPTLRWTGEVGDALMFWVWGSRAFVRDTSADKLSTRAIPCVFLGFPPDAPGWQFYHPTLRRVFPSQDVKFDDSVPFYRLLPYRSAPPPPPPLFLAPGPPPVNPLPPQGPAPSGVSQVNPLPGNVPVEVAGDSSVARGAASGGAEPGVVEPGSVEPGGAESEGAGSGGAEPGGAESGGAKPGGAESRGADSSGGPTDTGAGGVGAFPRAGGTGGTAAAGPGGALTGGTGAAGTGGVGGAGARDPTEPGVFGARGAGAGGTGAGAGGTGVGGARAGGAGAGGTGAGGAGARGARSGGITECREPASRPVSPVRIARRVPSSRPPPVPGTHAMALRPSFVPLRVPLLPPPESSLPVVPDPESDLVRAASPTVSRLLATVVTDPSFESTAASALVAELLPVEDFECLAAAVPRFASIMLAPEGDPDAPDIPTPRSYAEAITGPYSSQWVKRPPDSPSAFKARYVARGFSQRTGVDYFQTSSPTPKMAILWVLLHVAAQRDYELHSLDFSTTFLQGSLHEEIWLRRPPGFTWSFPAGTQWSLRRPVYGLRQSPREWHDTLRTTLTALGFAPSIAYSSLFVRTDTSLPPFYVLIYINNLVFATADTKAMTLVKSELSFSALDSRSPYHRPLLCLLATRSELHLRTSPTLGMGLVLGGRGPDVLTGHADASWVDDLATRWSSQGYTFDLGSSSVSWRSTRSSSVLSSSCEAEIYAGAMAAQELCWLTYLLTDLGEQLRSPLVLYVDNKAMIALCEKHKLEHRTKHIALRYFLARELQQRGQLRLAYVATRANTTDIFTNALLPACFASLDWSCDHLFSPTLPMGCNTQPSNLSLPLKPLRFAPRSTLLMLLPSIPLKLRVCFALRCPPHPLQPLLVFDPYPFSFLPLPSPLQPLLIFPARAFAAPPFDVRSLPSCDHIPASSSPSPFRAPPSFRPGASSAPVPPLPPSAASPPFRAPPASVPRASPVPPSVAPPLFHTPPTLPHPSSSLPPPSAAFPPFRAPPAFVPRASPFPPSTDSPPFRAPPAYPPPSSYLPPLSAASPPFRAPPAFVPLASPFPPSADSHLFRTPPAYPPPSSSLPPPSAASPFHAPSAFVPLASPFPPSSDSPLFPSPFPPSAASPPFRSPPACPPPSSSLPPPSAVSPLLRAPPTSVRRASPVPPSVAPLLFRAPPTSPPPSSSLPPPSVASPPFRAPPAFFPQASPFPPADSPLFCTPPVCPPPSSSLPPPSATSPHFCAPPIFVPRASPFPPSIVPPLVRAPPASPPPSSSLPPPSSAPPLAPLPRASYASVPPLIHLLLACFPTLIIPFPCSCLPPLIHHHNVAFRHLHLFLQFANNIQIPLPHFQTMPLLMFIILDPKVNDLQLFLQCDSRDGVSLFDHTSGVSTAPAATADSMVRSKWTTRDAVARLAVRGHLPPAERAHFGQYKTPQSLYDAVVARYSSPATAALSHLMLPYLFPDLAAFATVADLIAHLRTSDARYRAALPTEFDAKNPPPCRAGAVDLGGAVWPRPNFVPLLQQVLGVPSSTGLTPSLLCPPPDQSQLPLQPASPLPTPSPYTKQSNGLTERREPASRPVSPVRTARRVPCSRPPPVPGTRTMALCQSSIPLRVPLPAPPESSLPEVPDPESDRARATRPTVSHLLAIAVTDPSFESASASALIAELLVFAAACRLDYATTLVAEYAFVSVCPPSVGGECALGTDVLEDRQEDFECLAAAVPRFASMLLAPQADPDAPDIPTLRSYAEAITVPPSRANTVDNMWIFGVKWPLGSPSAFKVQYVARGFSQRHGVDYFQNFSPTPKMTTLRGSLHEEIWLRRPPGFTESFPAGTQWSLRQPVYSFRQAPREWHDRLRTTLAALGFAPSTADPSLFLCTDTLLPLFYVLVYVDDLVFATADTEALTLVKSKLQKRHTCTDLGPSALRLPILLAIAHSSVYQPLALSSTFKRVQRAEWSIPTACGHRKVHWHAAKRVPRYLCSTSGMGLVLGGRGPVVLTGHADASWVHDSATSSCEAEIYARAMAAQELRWLTYLLIDLGE
ncbi:unnamed protein product [Closterium sp. NIES-53]